MVERATVFKINAPEAMVLSENERATKKVLIVTSTQKKRKANSGTSILMYIITDFNESIFNLRFGECRM